MRIPKRMAGILFLLYSFFTFFQPEKIDSHDDVLLWISNVTPQQGVQTKFTQLDWQFALSNLHPLDLSLILQRKVADFSLSEQAN